MELDSTLVSDGGGPAASSLLARAPTAGRFTLLGKIGAGGMGVVYAAHDPELDRKVAVKVVLSAADGGPSSAGRARLLREAQALARLSHPNVVAVHDVGTHEGEVWIAMEFVAGQTLAAWARERPRRWPEVLRVLVDAARGVAAAHAVGLVHRDLKPDNVMISGDDRVRVMDFGLAHGRDLAGVELAATAVAEPHGSLDALAARLTQLGAVQGTPAYMAPEQWQGHEAAAAADQFGWSVMAWELLYGERPFAGDTLVTLAAAVLAGQRRPPPRGRRVPHWLRRVVERGLAVDPQRRWPSMAALLAALQRGRRRARLRAPALALAGLVVAAAVGLGVWRWQAVAGAARCAATAAELAETWDDAARQRLRAAFVATGLAHATSTAERVLPWIDRAVSSWSATRTEACERAELRGEWDADTERRALWCLEDRRMEIEALVQQLGQADGTAVTQAVTAASELRASWPCADVATLHRLPAPPNASVAIGEIRGELAQARSLGLTGRYEQALAVASQARARAESEGEWPPLTVAVGETEVDLLVSTGDYTSAEELATRVYFEALRLGAWETAQAAAIQLADVVGSTKARPVEGRAWVRHAEALAAHVADPGGLIEAARVTASAELEYAAGNHAAALPLFERALQLREATLGLDHPLVANALNNVGVVHMMLRDFPRARAQMDRSVEVATRTLGPEHPETATNMANLAVLLEEMHEQDAAQRLYERALQIREQALGPTHPDVARNLNNLATLRDAKGEHAAAQELYRRALAIQEKAYGADQLTVATTLNNLALSYQRTGADGEARALFERVLESFTAALGPEHVDVATIVSNLAGTYTRPEEAAKARALYERALVIREKTLGPIHPDVASTLAALARVALAQGRRKDARALVSRALTWYDAQPDRSAAEFGARFTLARTLLVTGGDRARALAQAERARAGFAGLGPVGAAELAVVDAWLAEQRRE